MARLPVAQENAALDAQVVTSTTYYLALFTTDPGTTGASGEVTGGSYARQAIVFGTAASAGSKASTTSQSFTGMPAEAGGVPYAALFSASTGGTYLGGMTTTGLSGAISVNATIDFAVGAVTFTNS